MHLFRHDAVLCNAHQGRGRVRLDKIAAKFKERLKITGRLLIGMFLFVVIVSVVMHIVYIPSVTNILSVSVVNSLLADHSGSGSEQALSAT